MNISYWGIPILCCLLFIFLKAWYKVNRISKEATILVAYIKWAKRGRNDILEKTDEDFYEKRFHDIMIACYLLHHFNTKVSKLPRTYHFHIIENGPTYGTTFEVQLGPFMQKLTETLVKTINKMPEIYQDKINAYLYAPFSNESKRISNEIKESLHPKNDKYLKKLAKESHRCIVDADFIYILCK